MKKLIITMGSVTYAVKAKKILMGNNIPVRLIKVDALLSERGCTHGVEIRYNDFLDVVAILKEHSIPYYVYQG